MRPGPTPDALVVEIIGGIEIHLPASLQTITTYVALEQEDWFEDEIAFVRRLLKPGMRAIDIGANYGLYGLTMAKAVGLQGRVWCIEPAPDVCTLLRASVAHNAFTNIDLVECALSNRSGRGRLRIETSAELNALSADGAAGQDVAIAMLDDLAEDRDFGAVDFVKIDAEGEEHNIIAGAARFLAEHSPLIMFERVSGETINNAAAAALVAHGFTLYRLAPGPALLVPAEEAMIDRYQLNLFACRPDRAARLETAGLLARTVITPEIPAENAWSTRAASLPCFAAMAPQPTAAADDAVAQLYRQALDLYAVSAAPGLTPPARWSALRQSLAMLVGVCQSAATGPRLFSLVRVAAEAGMREIALGALARLPLDGAAYGPSAMPEPFLPVCARFDGLDPGAEFGLWCAVSVFEQLEHLRAFSSFFAGDDALPYFEAFRNTRFHAPAMERRRQLIRMRTGKQYGPESHPALAERSPTHLNVAFWSRCG